MLSFTVPPAIAQTMRPTTAGDPPCVGNWTSPRVQWQPISLRDVRLGGFLGEHVDANNRVSLPAGLTSPIPAAFDAIAAGQPPPDACRRLASDSDLYNHYLGASSRDHLA
ncbi:MAG: hypothetical protein HY718_18430, partial [Planctomycetes bacterium]|nr:hypothetical protein [Planctomycetota bacterium]